MTTEQPSKPNTTAKLRKPQAPFPLVEIVWDDTVGHEDKWQEDAPLDFWLITSVGYLIKETEDHYMLVMDIAPDGQWNGGSQIPKGVVKFFKVLKRGRASKVKKAS